VGFLPWVYVLWDKIKFSLSDVIRAQVASVQGGDLIALLAEIRLALHNTEALKPHVLRNKFLASKFEVEGQKDVLTFISCLKTMAQRLDAVGKPVSDEDMQVTLVMGLPSELFPEVLTKHEAGLCAPKGTLTGFDVLCLEIKAFISRPAVDAKLRALKHVPGGALLHIQESKSQEGRVAMDQYVAALVAKTVAEKMRERGLPNSAGAAKKSVKKCFEFFKTGTCSRGTDCKYSHVPKDESKLCSIHGKGGHSDAECFKQQAQRPVAPGGPLASSGAAAVRQSDGRLERLMLALQASQPPEFLAMMALGVTNLLHKDKILVDSCATVHCSNDMSLAVSGSLRPYTGVVHGLGEFRVEWCFSTIVHDLEDPDYPDRVLPPLRLKIVLYHAAVPLRLIISRPGLADAGFVPTITRLTSAYEPRDGEPSSLRRRAVLREVFRTVAGDHVITADSDPVSGLAYARQRAKPGAVAMVVAPALKYEDHGLRTAGTPDSLLVPGPPNISISTHSLPRQRSLAESANIERIVWKHISLNHASGFKTCAQRLGLPLPEGLQCLGCGAGAPKESTYNPALSTRPTRRSEMFTMDWVPVPDPTSYGGFTGYFVIADVFTKKLFCIPAEGQFAWCSIFEGFVAVVEVHEQNPRAISFFLSDGGKVFESCLKCRSLCLSKGIQQLFSPPEEQKYNKAEGMGWHVKKVTNIVMLTSGFQELEPKLWDAAIIAANVSCDLMPVDTSTLELARGRTRFEAWHNIDVPDEVLQLRSYPMGCLVLPKVRARFHAGFGDKVDYCAYLFHDQRKKSHKLWNIVRKDFQWNSPNECEIYPTLMPMRNDSIMSRLLGQTVPPIPAGAVKSPEIRVPISQSVLGGVPEVMSNPVRRSTRPWVPSQEFIDSVHVVQGAVPPPVVEVQFAPVPLFLQHMFAVQMEVPELLSPQALQERTPRTLLEALSGEDAEQWKKALLRHFKVVRDRRCLGPATTVKPVGRVFKLKVLLTIKKSLAQVFAGGIPDAVFKTRTIFPGHLFEAGVQFDKTQIAALQIRPESIFLMAVYAAQHGKILVKLDAVEAFYGAEMVPRGIMCALPLGYDPENPDVLRPIDDPPLYAEAIAAFPGCPQGSLLFQKKAVKAYEGAGWITDASDDMVFKKRHPGQAMPDLSGLYVDDMYHVTDPDLRTLAMFLAPAPMGVGTDFPDLKFEYLRSFLGLEITTIYTPISRSIFFAHTKMLRDLLALRGYLKRKPVRTPMVSGAYVSKKDCPPLINGRVDPARRRKQEIFCSDNMVLNYIALWTRKDIKFPVRALATVMTNPGDIHFQILDHLMCYLLHTQDYGVEIVHTPFSEKVPVAIGFADSSHMDCPDTSGSTVTQVTTVNRTVIAAQVKVTEAVCDTIQISEFAASEAAIVPGPESGVLVPDAPSDADGVASSSYALRIPEVSTFLANGNAARTLVWVSRMIRWMFEVPPNVDVGAKLAIDNTGVITILRGTFHFEANKHAMHRMKLVKSLLGSEGIGTVKVASADNLANAISKNIPSADQSESELMQLAAPRGRHPTINYNLQGARFQEGDVVLFNTLGELPPMVLPDLGTVSRAGVREEKGAHRDTVLVSRSAGVVAPSDKFEGTEVFILPMFFVQTSTPLGRSEAANVLDYVVRHIVQSRADGCDENVLLDNITRIIAGARANSAAARGDPPNAWSETVRLPTSEVAPPPPPAGKPKKIIVSAASDSVAMAEPQSMPVLPVPFAPLSPFLTMCQSGRILTDVEAASAVQWLTKVQARNADFARLMRINGFAPNSLSSPLVSQEFKEFLPAGALDWNSRGAFGCDVCSIPVQPGPIQYAQHVLGLSHSERIDRFLAMFRVPGPDAREAVMRDAFCTDCLKIINPDFSMQEHCLSRKHIAAVTARRSVVSRASVVEWKGHSA
jgi:hypothetical protein